MAGKRKGAAPLSGRQAGCCAPTSGTRQNFAGARSPPSESFKQLVSSNPRPRKPSNNLFHPIRGLENLQTTCFIQSETSETFKQPVSSNPRPRKPSNNLFGHFRGLGLPASPPPTCTKPNFAGLAWSVAVCEMIVQHLHSVVTVCETAVQALRGPSQCVR